MNVRKMNAGDHVLWAHALFLNGKFRLYVSKDETIYKYDAW